MKNTGRKLLAAVCTVVLLAGCEGLPIGGSGAYLKDIKPSKYVKLGEYTGLTVQAEKPESSEAAEKQYIVTYLNAMADTEITDRAAKLGDTANIDYAGRLKDSGEYFEGGTAQGYNLPLGSGMFLAGFEDGVVGMKVGEKKELPLTFPEGYANSDLSGKDVIFEVTLNSLTGPTDESVKALGIDGVTDADAYYTYLKDQYAKRIDEQYRANIEEALQDKIESSSTFQTPPEALLERLQNSYREQIQILADAYSDAYGQTITVQDVLSAAMSMQGYSGDEDSYVRQSSIETANSYLAAAAIAKEQGITVSDEEVKEKMTESLSTTEYATIEEYMEASDLEAIREQVLFDKVMDFLIANNTIE